MRYTLDDIYQYLNQISPFDQQESWDNSGVNIGQLGSKNHITSIYLSLDIDMDLIDALPADSLLITHHPLIFKPLKCIGDDYASRLVVKMLQKNIKHIAMHTNFDQTHLNVYVLQKVLKLPLLHQDGFVAYGGFEGSFNDLMCMLQNNLQLPIIKHTPFRSTALISQIALTTGSGASLLSQVQADVFLTGDIKYHDAMIAKTMGLTLVDIGHYESEMHFGDCLGPLLSTLEIPITILNNTNPFKIVTTL